MFENKRKIVIHHTHLIDDIMSLLKNDDVVFFDDCLYSQYLFIKNNIKSLQLKNITCILGFSTKIYRTHQKPIIEKSDILHNRIHNNDIDAYGGFMSLDEIRELLNFHNVYLAGHGARHLELEKTNLSKLNQTKLFNEDVKEMRQDLDNMGFDTYMFIYPYDYYGLPCSQLILNLSGFKHIFNSYNNNRIYIEDVLK